MAAILMRRTGPAWFMRLRSFEGVIASGEKAFCGLLMLSMALATVASVVVRSFGLHLPNYAEIGLAALVPLTLIGGALCTYLGSHIAVEIIQATPSALVRRSAQLLSAIAVLTFAAIYFRSGMILVEEFLLTGDKLLDLNTPLWILALMFPVGMALMAFHTLMNLLDMMIGAPALTEGAA